MGKEYVCISCGHKWESRKNMGEPGKCPTCNSREIESLDKPYALSKRGTNWAERIVR